MGKIGTPKERQTRPRTNPAESEQYFSSERSSPGAKKILTSFRQVGGSVMVTIPKSVVELFSLKAGGTLNLWVEEDRLVLVPQKRPVYTLDELLAGAPETPAALSEFEKEWDALPPVGEEFI